MPIYTFSCAQCETEQDQYISRPSQRDDPQKCSACDNTMERVLFPAPPQFWIQDGAGCYDRGTLKGKFAPGLWYPDPMKVARKRRERGEV